MHVVMSFQGKVVQKGPLVSLGDEDYVLKAVIEGTALTRTMTASIH